MQSTGTPEGDICTYLCVLHAESEAVHAGELHCGWYDSVVVNHNVQTAYGIHTIYFSVVSMTYNIVLILYPTHCPCEAHILLEQQATSTTY